MKASLHIEAFAANGITHLSKCFCSPPFKVMNITEDKSAAELLLMVMSASPGILDGDEYDINIVLDKNSRLQLCTQAYQRLFQMKIGASQYMKVTVGEKASFVYLPHPTVPHEASIYKAITEVRLAKHATLIMGEILTCGRKLNDEVFAFSTYQNIIQIYQNDQLIIRENLLMMPALIEPSVIGQLEGYTHQASLIVIQPFISINETADTIHALLTEENDIEFGISTTHHQGLIIRILGYKAAQLHDCLNTIADIIKSMTNAPSHPENV